MKDGDVWVVSLGGSEPNLRSLVQTSAIEEAPEFSPDDRALAYESDESGRFEVYVQPYPGPGSRIQVSVNGGMSPAWNPRGGELFYATPFTPGEPRRLMAVDVRTNPQPRVGTPRLLFEFSPPARGQFPCGPIRCYDVAPDGQRFFAVGRLQAAPTPPAPVTQIHLVLNWFEELKAKVPAGR